MHAPLPPPNSQVMFWTPFSQIRNNWAAMLLQYAPPANSRVAYVDQYSVRFEYFELVRAFVGALAVERGGAAAALVAWCPACPTLGAVSCEPAAGEKHIVVGTVCALGDCLGLACVLTAQQSS